MCIRDRFLAADHARKVDPTLAASYQRLRAAGKHHNSALCTLAAVLVTRIAACWRHDQSYDLRDLDGRPLTEAEGRAICATLAPKAGTGRRSKESQALHRPARSVTRLETSARGA